MNCRHCADKLPCAPIHSIPDKINGFDFKFIISIVNLGT